MRASVDSSTPLLAEETNLQPVRCATRSWMLLQRRWILASVCLLLITAGLIFVVVLVSLSMSQHAPLQALPLVVPFYNATSGGHTSSARGWNSFGLQANPAIWPSIGGWNLTDFHLARQCERIVVPENSTADYYCSIDSGWSMNGGDEYGRFVPDPQVFTSFPPVLKGLADHLHQRGLKVGMYVLPGALADDEDRFIEVRCFCHGIVADDLLLIVIVQGTDIRLGDVLDYDEVYYHLRRPFKWDVNTAAVQAWHDSVIKHLASL